MSCWNSFATANSSAFPERRCRKAYWLAELPPKLLRSRLGQPRRRNPGLIRVPLPRDREPSSPSLALLALQVSLRKNLAAGSIDQRL